ncbi:hypothetical protein B0187_06755 [Haemophilus paracuniculus]|uniref:Uncharacterized protein n=1 Tax=Haemophilus paracuniculus TaxID=734 RepID=A0A1T0AS05_9PAST|nr:hypothetical protein [Haemophilus paracuniculus]OOR98956.1 hypothetical protein B0187_06755 [Haemophilus paracuniculus]
MAFPPLKVIQSLAETEGFDSWHTAKMAIEEVVQAVGNFINFAKDFPISPKTIQQIQQHLNQVWADNRTLLT